MCLLGLPGGSVVKNPPAMRETWVQSLVKKIPWRRAWQHTLLFLSGTLQSWQKLINCLQKRLSQVSVSSYHIKTGTIKSCANLTGGKWWLICFIFILLTRSKTDYPLFSMNWLTLCDLWLFFYWIVSWSFLTDMHDQFLHREISSFWCVLQIFFSCFIDCL